MNLPFWPNPQNFHHIELGLSRIREASKRLKNPHLKLPPTIHIAGTNGKGSTLAFLKSIFETTGLRVHRYISPHLVEFNERIELLGKPISDEFLNEILAECKELCEQHPAIPLTFFEGTTLAAFVAFSRVPADVLLLETGMGGEFDATNTLPSVCCSIISSISLDHQEFLGKTIAKIAEAKAGILKPNCLAVVANQEPQANEVIVKKAQEINTKLVSSNAENLQKLAVEFWGSDHGFDFENLDLSLIGKHQQENARLALASILVSQKFLVSAKQARLGLKAAKWPARLQKIEEGKFRQILPKNCEIYLDGAHNLQGAEAISDFLANCQEEKSAKFELSWRQDPKSDKIFTIFSMLQDKDCEGFLAKIAPQIDELLIIEMQNMPRARRAEEIFEIAKKLKISAKIFLNFDEVFEYLAAVLSKENYQKILSKKFQETPLKSPRSKVLICGSLYLAGEFLTKNF